MDDIKDTSGCIIGHHTLAEFADYVTKHVGNCYFVVYETYSSQPDAQKFRVLIPFDNPLRLLDREDVRAFNNRANESRAELVRAMPSAAD